MNIHPNETVTTQPQLAGPNQPIDLTISIININNREITLQCLDSVFSSTNDITLEVFVVNNSCQDGSSQAIRKQFPQVHLIEYNELLGYSTNNNLVLSQAQGRYWMLLNNDTIVHPGAFQAMVEFMDQHPEVGVVGAALINPDGSAQYCFDFLPHPVYEGLRPITEYLHLHPPSNNLPLETGYVCGACLMVRASAAKQIGILDPIFDPMYSEEVDWCYRFKQAGWKVYHLPEAKVTHLGEVSLRKTNLSRYELIYRKKAVYFRKHFGESSARLYKIILIISNFIKAIVWSSIWMFRKLTSLSTKRARLEMQIHWNIVKRARTF